MLSVLHCKTMQQLDAPFLIDFFHLAGLRLDEAREMLCVLDGAIGDGDHGSSMAGGFAAINDALRLSAQADPASVMRIAAQAFLAEVGATVGPLYATGLLEAGKRLQGKRLQLCELDLVLSGIADGIRRRGQADPGDKTMLDVWHSAALSAQRAGPDIAELAQAVDATARQAADSTRGMMAARGRAARLQERTIGHLDPGAASAAIVIGALCDAAKARVA